MAAGGICVQPPCSPQPWGSPLCHLPYLLPLPVPKCISNHIPNCICQMSLQEKLYNSCECIHCLWEGGEVAVGLFFLPFLFCSIMI